MKLSVLAQVAETSRLNAAVLTTTQSALNNASVHSLFYRIRWDNMHTGPGTFNDSYISPYLAMCAAAGKPIIIGVDLGDWCPQWICNITGFLTGNIVPGNASQPGRQIKSPIFWHPAYAQYYNELYNHIAAICAAAGVSVYAIKTACLGEQSSEFRLPGGYKPGLAITGSNGVTESDWQTMWFSAGFHTNDYQQITDVFNATFSNTRIKFPTSYYSLAVVGGSRPVWPLTTGAKPQITCGDIMYAAAPSQSIMQSNAAPKTVSFVNTWKGKGRLSAGQLNAGLFGNPNCPGNPTLSGDVSPTPCDHTNFANALATMAGGGATWLEIFLKNPLGTCYATECIPYGPAPPPVGAPAPILNYAVTKTPTSGVNMSWPMMAAGDTMTVSWSLDGGAYVPDAPYAYPATAATRHAVATGHSVVASAVYYRASDASTSPATVTIPLGNPLKPTSFVMTGIASGLHLSFITPATQPIGCSYEFWLKKTSDDISLADVWDTLDCVPGATQTIDLTGLLELTSYDVWIHPTNQWIQDADTSQDSNVHTTVTLMDPVGKIPPPTNVTLSNDGVQFSSDWVWPGTAVAGWQIEGQWVQNDFSGTPPIVEAAKNFPLNTDTFAANPEIPYVHQIRTYDGVGLWSFWAYSPSDIIHVMDDFHI